jgi:hypothetical protein
LLAIPSLPPYDPNLEKLTENYPKTFFAFEPPIQKETNFVSNLQNVSPPQSKREVKKEQKKKSKKHQSIWNLMPYVDESLLEHNVQTESGI